MKTETYRHVVTDLETGKKHEFTGPRNDERAIKMFLKLDRAEWQTDKVEICPTCKRIIKEGV